MSMKTLLHKLQARRAQAIVSLLILYLSFFAGWYWLWGLLLLSWALGDLLRGQTWLSETVDRHTHPYLYWAIIATWLAFGGYMIAAQFVAALR